MIPKAIISPQAEEDLSDIGVYTEKQWGKRQRKKYVAQLINGIQRLAKNPALAGKDRHATRAACEKFRHTPVSIINFVEGTRFTAAKHSSRKSPYAHLLAPRSGGIAYVVEAMGDVLDGVIDVSLFYPGGIPGAVDLFAGKVKRVAMKVELLSLPANLRGGDYAGDAECRKAFQAWLNERWQLKDAWIDSRARSQVDSGADSRAGRPGA